MYRDGHIKAMTQLSNICSASPVNNQTIFFNGHDRHFDYFSLINMDQQNTQPLILKEGESVNDQKNDNGLNAKMKSLCNELKSLWIMK